VIRCSAARRGTRKTREGERETLLCDLRRYRTCVGPSSNNAKCCFLQPAEGFLRPRGLYCLRRRYRRRPDVVIYQLTRTRLERHEPFVGMAAPPSTIMVLPSFVMLFFREGVRTTRTTTVSPRLLTRSGRIRRQRCVPPPLRSTRFNMAVFGLERNIRLAMMWALTSP
jgi:hypothetical protein